MSTNKNSALTCKALENAIKQPDQSRYLLYHSNRDSQSSTDKFQDYLLSNNMEIYMNNFPYSVTKVSKGSMNLRGDPYSNAVQENIFLKFKHKFIRGTMFKNIDEARLRYSDILR